MAYVLKSGGLPALPEALAVVCPKELGTMVPLDDWIRFTKESPQMREVLHDSNRPTAVFRNATGNEIEVVYLFGAVVAEKYSDLKRADILGELVGSLNDFTKNA